MTIECEHWEDPVACKDCNPPIDPVKIWHCKDHKGLCESNSHCPNTEHCCLTMKKVFHAIQECGDMESEHGCDIWNMKLCSYHIGKICYLFKKHEWDSY